MSYGDRIIADLGGTKALPPIDDEYSIGFEFAAGPGLDRPIQIDISKVHLNPYSNSEANVNRTVGFIHGIDVPQEPSEPIVMHAVEAEGRTLIHPNFAVSMGLGYASTRKGVGVTFSDNPDIRTSLAGLYSFGEREAELQMLFGGNPNITSTIQESTAVTITNAVARLIGPHMFRGLQMGPEPPVLKVTMSRHRDPSLIVEGIEAQDIANFDITTGKPAFI